KMGYMATLRNLRNILTADVSSESIDNVEEFLVNEKAVLNSKQLPFRFFSAYRELKGVDSVDAPRVLKALETATDISTKSVRGFSDEDKVYVSVDTSGSMEHPVSEKSKVNYMDIGFVCSMILRNITKRSEFSVFATKLLNVTLPTDNILRNVEESKALSGKVGHGTNGYVIPRDLLERKVEFDKVVIFTDCQMYNTSSYGYWGTDTDIKTFKEYWSQYRKEVAPNAKLYLFDLAGYGNTPLSIEQDGVYLIAGWSEKIFDLIEATENGATAVSEIEKTVV
ncbi:MAG: TROVE domain-containing protein, partial [Gammaproteobacteria bacterium]